jgi:hypothetical protein
MTGARWDVLHQALWRSSFLIGRTVSSRQLLMTTSLNCRRQRAYCSSPRWDISTEKPWWNNSSTRALWQSYQQSNLVAKLDERAKGMMNLTLRSISVHTCKWFFTSRKILRHGAGSFTSPKEGLLLIFITLKNPSSSLSLNPRTLGLMTSTLTITPPRQLGSYSASNHKLLTIMAIFPSHPTLYGLFSWTNVVK